MMGLLRWAVCVALAIALAGCAGAVDADHTRICRSLIPALNTAGATFEILRATPLSRASGVRVDYRVRGTAEPVRERFIACGFVGGGLAATERNALVAVATDAGRMGELRLHLLKRFWLGKEGLAADPEPVAGATQVMALPMPVALGLQHVLLALPGTAVYALLAAAYALVYGLVGRINLAFGELAATSGYAAFLGVAVLGAAGGLVGPLLLALCWGLAAALAYGIASGRFVFAPLMGQSGQRVLIGTVALAIVLQEFLRLAQGAKLQWMGPVLNAPYAVARAGDFVVTVTPIALVVVGVALLAAGAVLWLIRASRFGRAWRACADDPGAAELFGIDRRLVLLKTFALSSASAGLAGVVLTVYYGSIGYAGGFVLGLKALLAAVIGGIGSVPGAFVGGLLLGGAEAAWSALFPIEFRDLAIFTLLVVMLVLRPAGLLGVEDAAPRRSEASWR